MDHAKVYDFYGRDSHSDLWKEPKIKNKEYLKYEKVHFVSKLVL